MMPKTSNSAMALEPSVAVFDACILYPFHLRNIIVQAAVDRLVEARWTDEIHDEWIRNLAADTPTIPIERLQTTRRLMNDALPGATVSGYEDLIPTVSLPDPDDRHVVAAAIASGASVILTWNLRDFPATALKKYGLRRQTPDVFLTDLYDRAPDLTVASRVNARRNLNKSRVSASEFIDILGNQKLPQLVTRLKKHPTGL
jgi:PIN domain